MYGLRLSLRFTLLGSIVFLMLATFAVVWISATRGLRSSVVTMAEALSLEALGRVEQRTRGQLDAAQAASTLASSRVLELERTLRRPLEVSDLPELTSHLRDIMQVYPGLSFLSVSFAERGEYAHVQRSGGTLTAVEMSRPVDGVATQRYLRFVGPSRVQTRVDPRHRYDPRTRPFFKAAAEAEAGRKVWTDSYPSSLPTSGHIGWRPIASVAFPTRKSHYHPSR